MGKIKGYKAEHPYWGYRRIWASLRYKDGLMVNTKRIYRLMKKHDLLVKSNIKLKATRSITTTKPRATEVNQWWGIDMTKISINGFGWVYVVIVLDWYSKKVVGFHAGLQAKTKDWLQALDFALNRQFPDGIRNNSLNLMSDNGCQPTSLSFIKVCSHLGIKQAFTSYNNPKGNADTERFMRTMKEELVWINEFKSPSHFITAFEDWVNRYNNDYLHSSLGYKTPIQFECENIGQTTLEAA